MEREKVIIIFHALKQGLTTDLEIPLDISATDLVLALNTAYDLGIDTTNIKNCYLKAENPIALLRGDRTLRDFGIRSGSIIQYTE